MTGVLSSKTVRDFLSYFNNMESEYPMTYHGKFMMTILRR